MKIGGIEISGSTVLAPMAGVTDVAFRSVCREFGVGLTVTEMVSAKALVYRDKKTRSLLQLGGTEHPAGVQIFGSDAECMSEGAQLALSLSDADFIDINMGCPVGKVVKSGDGSALMRDIEKARRIIEAVVSAVPCPVTVKIRKGWDRGSVNAVEFAKMAEDAGVSAVTVHGRTRAAMYGGSADWDIIGEVKAALKIPVIANGDVFSAEDAQRAKKVTGADLIMVGRGAFGNPWIFSECEAVLRGGPKPIRPPISERIAVAVRQFELSCELKGEKIACLEARRHFAWYLKGVPHSVKYKMQISKVESLSDIKRIAELISRDLG